MKSFIIKPKTHGAGFRKLTKPKQKRKPSRKPGRKRSGRKSKRRSRKSKQRGGLLGLNGLIKSITL